MVHEVVIPLLARPALEVAEDIFKGLHDDVAKAECSDEFLKSVLDSVKLILGCLLALSGDTSVDRSAVTSVMGGRQGVLLLCAQAVQQSAAWLSRFEKWSKWESAEVEHGPAIQSCLAALANPSLEAMEEAMRQLPVWKDSVREGACILS